MHVGVRRARVRASQRLASWQIDVEGWAQVISTNDSNERLITILQLIAIHIVTLGILVDIRNMIELMDRREVALEAHL